MRNVAVGLVLLALVASGLFGLYLSGTFDSAGQNQGGGVVVGQPAPDFTLNGQDGKTYRLSALKGKVVLVNFWATWCPPCRAEIPSMDELYRGYKSGGLELLAINVEADGPQQVASFSKENPHSFPVLFDQDAAVQRLYGVYKFPETFVVNKQGIIVEKVVGAIDWTDPSVLSYFSRLLKE